MKRDEIGYIIKTVIFDKYRIYCFVRRFILVIFVTYYEKNKDIYIVEYAECQQCVVGTEREA